MPPLPSGDAVGFKAIQQSILEAKPFRMPLFAAFRRCPGLGRPQAPCHEAVHLRNGSEQAVHLVEGSEDQLLRSSRLLFMAVSRHSEPFLLLHPEELCSAILSGQQEATAVRVERLKRARQVINSIRSATAALAFQLPLKKVSTFIFAIKAH